MERMRITGNFIAFVAIALLVASPAWTHGMEGAMKPMQGGKPAKGMKQMRGMGGMKTPSDAPVVPPVTGYSEGREILFLHTEASDAKIAKSLTDMMGGSPVLYVPALAKASKELLAPVYVFTNGKTGEGPTGPLGGQADIFPHPPGDEAYRPLRAVILVTWKSEKSAHVLKSMGDLQRVIDGSAVNIKDSGVVVNMPFLTWPGGGR